MKMGPRNCDLIDLWCFLMLDGSSIASRSAFAFETESLLSVPDVMEMFCSDPVEWFPRSVNDNPLQRQRSTLTVKKSLCGKNKKPLHDKHVTVVRLLRYVRDAKPFTSTIHSRWSQIASCFYYILVFSFIRCRNDFFCSFEKTVTRREKERSWKDVLSEA